MRVTHLRVNHLENPLGYDLGVPSFSWQVTDTFSKRQAAARLWIALDPAFENLCYDSGEGPLNSLGEPGSLSHDSLYALLLESAGLGRSRRYGNEPGCMV